MERAVSVKLIIIPIIIGVITGYIFLHPASVLIFFIFEKNTFNLAEIILESFSLSHIAMSMYFAIIGGVLGGIIALYIVNLKTTNTGLFNLNNNLRNQNRQLQEKISVAKLDNKFIFKKIWPTINKIENGINLITNQSTGGLNLRQTALLSITKDNIDHLYEIIESLVLMKPENNRKNENNGYKIMERRKLWPG